MLWIKCQTSWKSNIFNEVSQLKTYIKKAESKAQKTTELLITLAILKRIQQIQLFDKISCAKMYCDAHDLTEIQIIFDSIFIGLWIQIVRDYLNAKINISIVSSCFEYVKLVNRTLISHLCQIILSESWMGLTEEN